MGSTRRLLLDVAPLVVWTAVIWISRIRNIIEDDELSTSGRVLSIGIAVLFVVLATITAVFLWSSRHRGLTRFGSRFIVGFAAWTIGYWVIRSLEILLDDHSGAFKAVHTALAVVSCALAVLAWRAVTGTSERVMAEAQS